MDRYSLAARVYPMVLIFMPFVLIGAIFSFNYKEYTPFFASLSVAGALGFLFSQLGRDSGKKKEKQLWEDWDGMPSIVLLRWRNNELNSSIKQRYHEKLQQKCRQAPTPNEAFEQSNALKCDEAYLAWTKFIISNTRDKKTYNLLFAENVNYGFRRNLWGMKGFALSLIVLCMLGIFAYFLYTLHHFKFWTYPRHFMIAEAVMTLCLLFWLIFIRKSWVRVAAFAYAERLLECTEKL